MIFSEVDLFWYLSPLSLGKPVWLIWILARATVFFQRRHLSRLSWPCGLLQNPEKLYWLFLGTISLKWDLSLRLIFWKFLFFLFLIITRMLPPPYLPSCWSYVGHIFVDVLALPIYLVFMGLPYHLILLNALVILFALCVCMCTSACTWCVSYWDNCRFTCKMWYREVLCIFFSLFFSDKILQNYI